MGKVLRRAVLSIVVVAAIAYVSALGLLYFKQRDFEYDPAGTVLPLNQTKLIAAQEVIIPTSEGQAVHGWYEAPAADKPVILYMKGNSGSFTDEHVRYEAFVDAGYGFLAFDYRGFPDSPGIVSQQNILADALAAYDWLSGQPYRIVVWGRSLGSGPATYAASKREPDALLLETPFLSAAHVAFQRYPIMPVFWLMHDQFPVNNWIGGVRAPVFVAHGTADRTIPVDNGKAVYALATDKAGLWIVPGADHSDLWAAGIWNKAQAFFAEAEARAARQ